jgi:rhodanese-related sulfurtransferase
MEMSDVKTVSVNQLSELSGQEPIELIDVRTPAEFREVHATIARNVPLESLDPHAVMQARNGSCDKTLYLVCRSGNRSAMACRKFIEAGYANVASVDGGTTAWESTGLPVVKGKKAMSLERQVRIAAGFLVLLGAVLGFFVHPYFVGLSAFVGAGLMFAGITDTCGMAMMLAKMPWNQCGGHSCSASR